MNLLAAAAARRSLFIPKTPRHRKLWNQAYYKSQHGDPESAVLLADRACELAIKRGIGKLLDAKVPDAALRAAIIELVRRASIIDEKVLGLFAALTGLHLQEAPCWGAFRSARRVRNDIAHEDYSPSAKEAAEALQASASVLGFIDDAVRVVSASRATA